MKKFFLIMLAISTATFARSEEIPAPVSVNCTATAGEFADKTVVSWPSATEHTSWAVYRSTRESGPFELIATVAVASYEDTAGEPGLQYWYRVAPVINEVPDNPGNTSAGHRKIPLMTSLDLDSLIKAKSQPAPVLKTDEEKLKDENYRALIGKYRKNPAEINVLNHVIRSYLKKGAIVALAGFNNYELNYEKREITVYDKNYACMVQFTSSKFFRMLVEGHINKLITFEQRELVDIMVRNMTAFCVYREVRPITDADGNMRFLPCYDAIGITMELYKNYKDWKNNTLVFATGDKELEKKVQLYRQDFDYK